PGGDRAPGAPGAGVGCVRAIPACQGLGTPYMDAAARAVVGGLSRATTRAHVVRAMLEGIAWRCREVYDALRADCPFAPPVALRVDGGAACNDLLLQLQADALGLPVERPAVLQAGALGAGYLAGLATGVWATTDELRDVWRRERLFEPAAGADERETRFAAWQRPVRAAVNVAAIAGGAGLAATAPVRLAAEVARRIGVTEVQVGVPFPASALEPVRFSCAGPALPELLYQGRVYSPAEACARRLADT